MVAIKTVDLRNDFKKVSDMINAGEIVLIARPRNENLVVLSEREYNELEKAKRNAEYLTMVDKSAKEITDGKIISFTIEELDAMETMTAEEALSFVAEVRRGYNS
ncbi:MAG: type II toxin-antitoxin system Phd/YefM family antitoxin [Oscillospiraceae bacterium]|nr:type II toxin-antitoxin system Phd/YefM family antitoxin [Oscillospiraceae bacterium]